MTNRKGTMSNKIGLAAAFQMMGVDLSAEPDAIRVAARLCLQPVMKVEGHHACQVVGIIFGSELAGVRHHRVWDGDVAFHPEIIMEDRAGKLVGNGLAGLATGGGLSIAPNETPYNHVVYRRGNQ